MDNIFGDVISSYSREQAIEDGELVDVRRQSRTPGASSAPKIEERPPTSPRCEAGEDENHLFPGEGLEDRDMTNLEAFALARHRGRFAHYDSVVSKDRAGNWFCERYSGEAIKRAMLATGTSGRFWVVGTGHPSIIRWPEAALRLRNARHFA